MAARYPLRRREYHRDVSDLPTAASLFRSIGLMADGPTVWGRPVPAQGPGVFVLESPRPLATAPIELTRVGKWIERVETLRLDGERPSTRALAARLAAYWLPSQTVVYIGATDASVGRRVASIAATALGDRRPSSSGHWLKTLRSLDGVRVWWALTDATEEYEDALLAAFAEGVPAAERAALPDPGVVLPFANLRRPTGERRATGLTGSLLAEPVVAPPPPTHVVVVPDGDADGARGEPPAKVAKTARTTKTAAPAPVRSAATTSRRAAKAPITLTADGAARMREELDELRDIRRPEVIARIRAAKELGDLKENADYTAAREEQSFLEGRIQALEGRLRDVIIAEARAAGMHADIGSVVTVSVDGVAVTYTLVGSAEADAGAGRLSIMSPVGRALVGSMAGDEVAVETPRGRATYDVIAID
jgi:transcription elongation factor GreA